MKQFLRNNSLSLVFFLLFLLTIVAQTVTGFKQFNYKEREEGGKTVSVWSYLSTGHFIEATFENWESEFLQMALFVWLSTFLYQKGSSESKDPEGKEKVDRKPDNKRSEAPMPVHKGGPYLYVYQNSLTLVLFLLFLLSFGAHWYGSLKEYNAGRALKGLPGQTAFEYLSNSKLWFESFENWQSEFLSVFSIVVLSVFLRQKGSAQSKPVDAPHSETG